MIDKKIRHSYEFGPFRIDDVNRCLMSNGELVPLKAKAIEVLLLLIERRGEVVAKDELMSRLWPNTFVEEGNLTQNIYTLRKALGDGNYIENVPRRGYRFVADVRTDGDPASELIVVKEKTITSLSYEEEVEATPADFNHAAVDLRPAVIDVSPETRTKALSMSRSLKWALPATAALLAIVVLALWPRNPKIPFENVRITRFTTSGNAFRAAISPDGKYLAYVVNEPSQKSIWLRQITTGQDLQIVPPVQIEWFYGLTFSPDSNYLYYVNQQMNQIGKLFRVPTLGGPPTKLVEDVDSPVTLSPDGKRIAFMRADKNGHSITLVDADGNGERKLFSSTHDDPFTVGPLWQIPPAWSPDGKSIAFPVGLKGPDGPYQTIWGVRIEDEKAKPLTTHSWARLARMAWLDDGSGLVTGAAEKGSDAGEQIWFIALPSGTARKITNDLNGYGDIGVTRDGQTVLAVQWERTANIWRTSLRQPSETTQITSTNYDGMDGLSFTPDGKIVYTLNSGGEENLWVTGSKGEAPRQLTSNAGLNQQPVVSPDGQYVVFVSNRTGTQHLWRINIDGTHPMELTTGSFDRDPSFGPDGQSVVYRSSDSARSVIMRVGIAGGDPVLVRDNAWEPVVSHDGKQIAFTFRPETANKIAVMPYSGGEPRLLTNLPAHFGVFRWLSDGSGLAYADKQNGKGNIWIQPIDGSLPTQLTSWKPDPIYALDVSRDGKWLASANGTLTMDVVLIKDVKHQ
jgi:Tol biopolymer transport system component/DNA-binding winged helix-turn-helix (wHTH) protein